MTQSYHLQNHSESGLHRGANLLTNFGKQLLQVVLKGVLADGSSLVLEHLPIEGQEMAEDGTLVEELVLESSGLCLSLAASTTLTPLLVFSWKTIFPHWVGPPRDLQVALRRRRLQVLSLSVTYMKRLRLVVVRFILAKAQLGEIRGVVGNENLFVLRLVPLSRQVQIILVYNLVVYIQIAL
jgi:hypothetical protein